MSRSTLTSWIEDAEARQVARSALFERPQPSETHYLHLGHAIARVPCWTRNHVSSGALATLGGHALSRVLHPRSNAGR